MKEPRPARNRRLRILLSIVIVLTLVSVTINGIGVVPAKDVGGIAIIIPTFTINPILFEVNIPDHNLSQALHAACSKPMTEPLTFADLADLTDHLNISGKNIANLEGVQHCVNISSLTASNNPISTVPDMSIMTGLRFLKLDRCEFTQIPAKIAQIPNLITLDMNSNRITTAGGINGCLKLTELYLANNLLDSLPGVLSLPKLLYIDLTNNKFESFPAVLFGLATLRSIIINRNQLTELPTELSTMPNLGRLSAARNKIRAIPASYGSSRIATLYLQENRITSLPDTLFDADYLDMLDVSVNRLTSVPAAIDDIDYFYLNVEFNYINITPGSPARILLDGVTAGTKSYLRQLTPITNLTAAPAETSIRLDWDRCPDIEAIEYSMKVKNYIVYLNTAGSMTALATLGKNITTYTESGLASGQERKYTVAVVYELNAPALDTTSTHYTSLASRTLNPPTTVTTAPSASETTETSAASTSEPTPSASGSETENSTETRATTEQPASPTTQDGDNRPESEFPWQTILIGVAALAVGSIVTVLVMKSRKVR